MLCKGRTHVLGVSEPGAPSGSPHPRFLRPHRSPTSCARRAMASAAACHCCWWRRAAAAIPHGLCVAIISPEDSPCLASLPDLADVAFVHNEMEQFEASPHFNDVSAIVFVAAGDRSNSSPIFSTHWARMSDGCIRFSPAWT